MKQKYIRLIIISLTVFLLDSCSASQNNTRQACTNIETENFTTQSVIGHKENRVVSLYETAKYIDHETFARIKEVYDGIDFYGSFNQGQNLEFYKEQFKRLLEGGSYPYRKKQE